MRFTVTLLLASVVTCLPLSAQPSSDFAHQGEGAFRLLKRNGLHPSKSVLAEFHELNAGKFTPDGGLRKDVEYTLPVSALDEPLFGASYRTVDLREASLDRAVFYLISGHGGADPGSIGKRGSHRLYEDEYAYDVMLRFAREALSRGATVYILTRDDDGIRDTKYLKPDHDEKHFNGKNVGSGQLNRLKTRVDEVNRLSKKHAGAYQRVVEFHVDYFHSSRQIDVDFYYVSKRGRTLAERLRDTMAKKYHAAQPGRGYNGRVLAKDLYTPRHTIPVTAYIELGNINHSGDQIRIVEPGNRQAISEWLVDAFIEDMHESSR